MAVRDFDTLGLVIGIKDPIDDTKIAAFDVSAATTGTTSTLTFIQTVDQTIEFPDASGCVAVESSETANVTTISSSLDINTRTSFIDSNLAATGLATLADPSIVFEKSIVYSAETGGTFPVDVTVTNVIDSTGTDRTVIRLPNKGTGIGLIWNGTGWTIRSITGSVTFS